MTNDRSAFLHPKGIKGAEAVASAIFLARNGSGKEEIRDYIIGNFGYDLSRTRGEIRTVYHHAESCQKTVPEAIAAFLEAAGPGLLKKCRDDQMRECYQNVINACVAEKEEIKK